MKSVKSYCNIYELRLLKINGTRMNWRKYLFNRHLRRQNFRILQINQCRISILQISHQILSNKEEKIFISGLIRNSNTFVIPKIMILAVQKTSTLFLLLQLLSIKPLILLGHGLKYCFEASNNTVFFLCF